MQQERGYLLESRFIHGLLIAIGTVLFAIAMLQLPLSVYFQNTKPAFDWRRTETLPVGIVVTPVKGEVEGPFAGKLRKGDIITKFDGIPLDSASFNETAVWQKINALMLGDTVRLEVLRDGTSITFVSILDVPRSEFFGDQISTIQYLTYNVAPLASIAIALIILVRQRRRRLSSLFALVTFSIGFYLLTIVQFGSPMPWWQWLDPYIMYVGQVVLYFFFALLVHLLAVFPFERKINGSVILWNAVIYLPPVVFSVIVVFFILVFELLKQGAWLESAIAVYGGAYPLIGAGILISSYRKAVSPAIKKVVSVLGIGVGLFGIASALLLFIGYVLPDVSETMRLWIRVVLLIVLTFSLPVTFGYAILRYGFMDVRIIVRQAAVYTILSGIVIAGFLGMYFLLLAYDGKFSQRDTLFISLVVSGLLLFAIVILKDRIQDFVTRRLFRQGYETGLRLHKLGRRLLHFLERDAFLKHLCTELPASMDLTSAAVIGIADGGAVLLCGSESHVATAAGIMEFQSVRRQLNEGGVVIVNTVREMPFNEDVHALFAINMDDGSDVIVTLGDKKNGRPFSDDELEQLRSIADHATLGWRNAAVTEELKDRERIKKEMEIAQSIQMSLLPHGMPHVPGLDIAAYTTPALEVGGDFYDMLPLDDGRMVVSVGDVSDKGISAAMVMASAMSILRLVAEISATPKEMLESANRRLYYDTRKQMFVAVCTAIVDTLQRTMTFTNAGLPLPLLYRDGEAFSIVWSDNGEHLPLGAKLDTYYHQQTVELERGDIILLYTDGAVESVNEHNEEFGVKRIKQSVVRSDGMTCERILQNIHDDIHAFTGSTAIFDDIALVCMRIV